jgi:hypothetical protein
MDRPALTPTQTSVLAADPAGQAIGSALAWGGPRSRGVPAPATRRAADESQFMPKAPATSPIDLASTDLGPAEHTSTNVCFAENTFG